MNSIKNSAGWPPELNILLEIWYVIACFAFLSFVKYKSSEKDK